MAKKTNGKVILILIIILVCLLFAVLCFFLIKRFLARHTYDGGGSVNTAAITSLDYYSGQDEYGCAESIYYRNGSFTYTHGGGTMEESYDVTYDVDTDFETALESIVTEYGVNGWTDLPANDIEVDDGPMTTMTIVFADGSVVSLGDSYQMPENGWIAVREFVALFQSKWESDENLALYGTAEEILSAEDKGLTLVADYCEETLATDDGEGYSEIVLYRNDEDGSYQLHTYSRYGSEAEEHEAYTATEAMALAVLALIEEKELAQYEGESGSGTVEGMEYVVKYLEGDTEIRISSENLSESEVGRLEAVGRLLYAFLPKYE